MPTPLPFEQEAPTWRERRKASRRLASRRAALSAAMPAPDPSSQIDPITGQSVQRARPSLAAKQAQLEQVETSPEEGRERRTWFKFFMDRKTLWSSLWRVAAAGFALTIGLTAGLPVLGHKWHVEWLVLAAVVLVFAIPGIARRWSLLSWLQKILVAATSLAFVVFLGAGLLSDPVVVNGVVYPEISATAEQVRYAQQIRDDLLTLGDMDKYLASSTAEAWSRTDDIKQAKAQAEAIGQKYRNIVDSDSLPAGQFGPPTSFVVTSAYSMSKALDLRLKLLEAGDDKLAKDLETARATFREEWSSAGNALGEAVRQLQIPLEVPTGPVES